MTQAGSGVRRLRAAVSRGLYLARTGGLAAGIILFRRRIPLAVSWVITGRCSSRCRYCAIWRDPPPELTTGEALAAIREMAALGTARVHFTGGEPLLREDIGLLIKECRNFGIAPALNTNGALVSRRLADLVPLSCLNVSLDGPEEVHDAVRGAGSHRQALEAARAARGAGIAVRLLCTITSVNRGALGFVVETAARLGASAQFQPATALLLAGEDPNPVAPLPADMIDGVDTLLSLKRQGKPVANSEPCLRHLRPWPEVGWLRCAGGRLFCAIDPTGHVKRCNEMRSLTSRNNLRSAGFAAAFRSVELVAGCGRCDCASIVEMNLASTLSGKAIRDLVRSL